MRLFEKTAKQKSHFDFVNEQKQDEL